MKLAALYPTGAQRAQVSEKTASGTRAAAMPLG
jgi:hypothetical protein